MDPTETALYQHQMDLPSEAATISIARRLAAVARSGDVIALSGDLGAGKTCFARGFIGALTGQAEDKPVEDLIARDPAMVCCEITWLTLFLVGL